MAWSFKDVLSKPFHKPLHTLGYGAAIGLGGAGLYSLGAGALAGGADAAGKGALLGGLLGAGANIYGSNQQSKALGQASEMQLQGTREAIAAEQQAIAEQRKLYEPYREFGESMLPKLGEELGVTYDPATGKYTATPNFTPRESPLYKWQLEKGLETLRARYSPRYAGGTRMAQIEADYIAKLNAEEADKLYGRQRDILGLGAGITGQQAGSEQQYGGALANLQYQGGAGQANIASERGKARSGMYETLGQGIIGGTQGYLNYLQGQNTNDVLRQQLALMQQGMPKDPNISTEYITEYVYPKKKQIPYIYNPQGSIG